MLEILAESAWADRFGWVLVHTLWQFALVAVFAVVLQWALHRCTAVTRYWALLAAMCVLVALPVVTWFSLGSADTPVGTVALATVEAPEANFRSEPTYDSPSPLVETATMRGSAPALSAHEFAAAPQPEPHRTDPAPVESVSLFSLVQRHVQSCLPEIVLVWFVGVLVAALRPLLSWYTVRRLRTVGVSPVEDTVQAALKRTAERLGFARSVEVLQSALVKAPVVVGYLRPAILLPLSVLTGLPESQLELILAHELAHIRRHDYLINLIQTLVETLFFYHPGVWWLSRQISDEREHCCDDVAMAALGSRADYGRALLAIEELRAAATPLSLAARGGSLLVRIRRIVGCEPAPRIAGGASILCVILVSLAISAAVTWGATSPPEKTEKPAAATATDAAAEAKDGETEEPAEGDWKPGQTIDVQVIHAQTKEPLPGVKLEFQYHGPGIDFQDVTTKTTDAEGRSQGKLPDLRPDAVRIYPSKPGFVPMRVYWGDDLPSPKLPKAATIRMQPGTVWGGVVQDEEGNPIPDVTVTVHYWESPAGNWQPHIRANIDEKTTTDKDGHWRIDVMPAKVIEDQVQIYVSHPEYVSDHLRRGFIPRPITERPSVEALQAQTAVTVMRKGGVVEGRVIDVAGQPISGVRIYTGEYYWFDSRKPAATTGDDGGFRIANLSFKSSGMNNPPPSTMRAVELREAALTVQAEGYTPELVHADPNGSNSPLDITLKPGQAVEGRVTDESGKPLEGVSVSASNWLGYRSRLGLTTKTDADGKFRLSDAPRSGVLYNFLKKGYMAVQDFPMSPQSTGQPANEGYQVTLKAPLRVVGSIVDAETGQPLARCTVIKGVEYDDGRAPDWQRVIGTKTITDGRYKFEFADGVFFWRIRVESDGYMPAVSRIFRPGISDKGQVTYDFTLSKAAPLTGAVLDADGRPLAGAEVYLATNLFRVDDGKATSYSLRNARIARTDAAGRFELPPEVEPFYLVVLHEKGYAVIDEKQFAADSTVRIEPWTAGNRSFEAYRRPHTHSQRPAAADAKGVLTVRLVDEDGKPVAGAQVGTSADFVPPQPNRVAPYEANWYYWNGTLSDRDGTTCIADGPMNCVVARHVERKLVAIQRISPEHVKSSETVTITMQPQCKVFGRLTAKELEARNRKIEWSNVYVHLESKSARPMSCTPDRTGFHFFLPPGTYELEAYANDTQHARKTITVKPGQQELEVEPIDLPPTGLVLLEGKPAPELRDIVAWKNGGPVKLSDLKGKVVVLAFSAHWVADRPHEWMPNLFTICGKYRDQGLALVDIRLGGRGIDSQAQLDERIAEMKSPFWDDRDLPIPIALGLWNRPPFLRNEEEKKDNRYLPCAIFKDYGIGIGDGRIALPLGVLIDRQGRIVGEFDLRSDGDNAVLERALKED